MMVDEPKNSLSRRNKWLWCLDRPFFNKDLQTLIRENYMPRVSWIGKPFLKLVTCQINNNVISPHVKLFKLEA